MELPGFWLTTTPRVHIGIVLGLGGNRRQQTVHFGIGIVFNCSNRLLTGDTQPSSMSGHILFLVIPCDTSHVAGYQPMTRSVASVTYDAGDAEEESDDIEKLPDCSQRHSLLVRKKNKKLSDS